MPTPANTSPGARSAPASPCIKICVLDAEGFCAGCLRTGDEIARWTSMTAGEQWQLLEVLRERHRQRLAAGDPPAGDLKLGAGGLGGAS